MLFSEFKRQSRNRWNEYFTFAANNLRFMETDGLPLFPTHIIFCDFGLYYSMELVGASTSPVLLEQKVAKCPDINALWNPLGIEGDKPAAIFNSDEGFVPEGAPRLEQLLFHQGEDVDQAKERFPGLAEYRTHLSWRNSKGPIFRFGPNFCGCILSNVMFIQRDKDIFRARNFSFFGAIPKAYRKQDLDRFLDRAMYPEGRNANPMNIQGIATVAAEKAKLAEATALQGLFLTSGIHETTIDSFFEDHPQILESVFGSKKVLYNTNFDWVEGDDISTKKAIRPDAMVERADGFYDIVDFKLAKVDLKSIVKGVDRARIGFNSYVMDGIHQLDNYEHYFEFEKNRDFGWQKYGVRVKNPRKTLVVGNLENVDLAEVRRALGPFKNGFEILDYDTLVSLYLKE